LEPSARPELAGSKETHGRLTYNQQKEGLVVLNRPPRP